MTTPEQVVAQLHALVNPWPDAISDPAAAQERVLERLVSIYRGTGYGRERGAAGVGSLPHYRKAFPIATYEDYKPLLGRVMAGEVDLLLTEPPIGWAITRGTTPGEEKFIPMTPTDLQMRVAAGRAMVHYALETRRFDLFEGVNLNLNFPSVVGTVRMGDREVEYGYSSGIYTKHISRETPIRSVPPQEEIDAVGGGKATRDWNARFELAYGKCKDENVTLVGGVAPTAIGFGRWLRRVHGVYPKTLWKVQIITLGSVPGINTRLAPTLRTLYGRAAIREIYGGDGGDVRPTERWPEDMGSELRPVPVRGQNGPWQGEAPPRDETRGDGKPRRVHTDPCSVRDRGPRARRAATLLPLHRPRPTVDAAPVPVGRALDPQPRPPVDRTSSHR